jgi:antitoxin Phd
VKTVQIPDAEATFSALVDDAVRGEPTMVTRNGAPAAVLVPIDAARRIYADSHVGFADFLLAFPGGIEFERDRTPMREIDI